MQRILTELIDREGGYVNHPNDRGGPTNMGITLKALADWRGSPVTAEDVELITEDEVRTIYLDRYWVRPRFDQLHLSPSLAAMVLDASVHHGPGQAAKLLQRSVSVSADGIIGPHTRMAVGRMKPIQLAAKLMAERVELMGKIITKRPDQSVFALGWMRRCAEFITDIPSA